MDKICYKLVVYVLRANLVNQGLGCAVDCVYENFKLLFIRARVHFLSPLDKLKSKTQNLRH